MNLIITSSTKLSNIVQIKKVFAFMTLNCCWFLVTIVTFYKEPGSKLACGLRLRNLVHLFNS